MAGSTRQGDSFPGGPRLRVQVEYNGRKYGEIEFSVTSEEENWGAEFFHEICKVPYRWEREGKGEVLCVDEQDSQRFVLRGCCSATLRDAEGNNIGTCGRPGVAPAPTHDGVVCKDHKSKRRMPWARG